MSQKPSRIDQFKDALAATTRAITTDPTSEIAFAFEGTHRVGNAITVKHPSQDFAVAAVRQTRGQADAEAIWLAYHDATRLAVALRGQDADARPLLRVAESVRVQALATARMKGAGDNLNALFTTRAQDMPALESPTQDTTQMTTALEFFLREKLMPHTLPMAAKTYLTPWQDEFEAHYAGLDSDLTATLADQDKFSAVISQFIHLLFPDEAEEPEKPDDTDTPDDTDADQPDDATPDKSQDDNDGEGEDGDKSPQNDMAMQFDSDGDGRDVDMDDASLLQFDDLLDDADAMEAHDMPMRPNFPEPDTTGTIAYKAYTTEFDETINAEDLCDADELNRLRAYLDTQLESLKGAVNKLANKLQRKLIAQQNRRWMFDQEEGILDTARLTRILTDPNAPLTFKQEEDSRFRDTVVTLLLDNSGSMRGRPIMITALTADILARTLERCRVKVEILGFTTRAWKGGRAKAKWVEDGKQPHQPGRLNDLRHIIYKSADTPLRRAKANLGLMMREGILKENIDGEAIEWAHARLMARPEKRKILLVISDGAPVDDATQNANLSNYLDVHLKETVEKIEKTSPVELLAIGIGHDVTKRYKRAVKITDAEQLGGAITDQLTELFALPRKEDSPRRARK